MNTEEPLVSLEEFLNRKRDYSPFLVHLTKDSEYNNEIVDAQDVLANILEQKTLVASNHFCLFSPNLKESQSTDLESKFKVICFTETPLDQIDILLKEIIERNFKPKPYGLVFKKEYIREHGGNPVFYTSKDTAKPLWKIYWPLCYENQEQPFEDICKLLALVSVCEKGNDWHWEREWRIVGNLKFNLSDVFCGLCPEEEIKYFENKFPIVFIDPYWRINAILSNLVGNKSEVDNG